MYNFGLYSTAVDLSLGLFSNIIGIELALKTNPDGFNGLSLWDQSLDKRRPDGKNGRSWASGNGSQIPWSTTGFAKLSPSTESLNDFDNRDLWNLADEYELQLASVYDISEERQSGSAETVLYFLDKSEGIGYPLDALLLSNHGGSFMDGFNGDGPAYDNDPEEKWMQVTELANTLRIYQEDIEENKLGLFGFDECNMANIETIAELYPYIHYFIASQETVSATGLDYYTPLSEQLPLQSDEPNDIKSYSKQLGIDFVDAFANYYNDDEKPFSDPEAPAGATMSLVNSDNVASLLKACEEFAIAFEQSSDQFIDSFLRDLNNRGTKYGYYHQADLGQVAQLAFHNSFATNKLKQACEEVLDYLNAAVTRNNRGYRPNTGNFSEGSSSGLTVTLLRNYRDHQEWDYEEDFASQAPEFEQATQWQSRVLDRSKVVLQDVYENIDDYYDVSESPLEESFSSPEEEIDFSENAIEEEQKLKRSRMADDYILQRQSHYNGTLSPAKGKAAVLTLRQNGLLEDSTESLQINSQSFVIPDHSGELKLQNITLHLTADGINTPGEVSIKIIDKNGNIKGKTRAKINSDNRFIEIQGKHLYKNRSGDPGPVLATSDQLILSAIGVTSIVYDLDLSIHNHELGNDPFHYIEPDQQGLMKYIPRLADSSQINLRVEKDQPYSFKFTTPVKPPTEDTQNDGFFTTFELKSSGNSPSRITFVNEEDVSMTFQGTSHFKFDGFLDSNETYDVTIGYRGNRESKESNINLTVDQEQQDTPNWAGFYDYLKDAELRTDERPEAKASDAVILTAIRTPKDIVTAIQMPKSIDTIAVLNSFKGKNLKKKVSLNTVKSLGKSQIIDINKPISNSSGIWECDKQRVKLNLTNNSSKELKFGLFEVDPLTGSVQSRKGESIGPADTDQFYRAAFQNLADSLITVSVESLIKPAKFSLQKKSAYAALLTWKENGERHTLYSLPQANPGNEPNMVHFGNFFYGFDLSSNQERDKDFVDLILEVDYSQ